MSIRARLVALVAALLLPISALAQAPTVFPGKVRIASTAADGLCIGATSVSPASSSCTGGIYAGALVIGGGTSITSSSNIALLASNNTWTAGTQAVTPGTATNNASFSFNNTGGATAVGSDNSTGSAFGTGTNYAAVFITSSTGGMAIGTNGATALRIRTNSADRWSYNSSGHYIPNGGNTFNIGDSTNTIKDIYVGGVDYHANGSAASPSDTFTSETDTGVYRYSADGLGLAAGGKLIAAATYGVIGSNIHAFTLDSHADGTSGAMLIIGRNTGGAAGILELTDKDNASTHDLWSDATGMLRIGAGPTTAGGDTGGTVVGTQTSTRESKNIHGAFTDYAGALRTMLTTPLYRFEYKSGAYNQQQFVGITTDDSPIFGMDLGRSFNPVTAFGYTVAAFKAQQHEIDRLTARVRVMEQARRGGAR